MPFYKKSSRRLLNPRLDTAPTCNVIDGSVVISAQVLFKVFKQVIARRLYLSYSLVSAIRRMWNNCPVQF